MARHHKIGLDYWPHDVSLSDDGKVMVLETIHGLTGFAVLVKLYERVYAQGFALSWMDHDVVAFSNRLHMERDKVEAIVDSAIKVGLFDFTLYDRHRILTSAGIQRRYLEVARRRKQFAIPKHLLLVDPESYSQVVDNLGKTPDPVPSPVKMTDAPPVPDSTKSELMSTEMDSCRHDVDNNPINVDKNALMSLSIAERKEKKRKEKEREEEALVIRRDEARSGKELVEMPFVLRLKDVEMDLFASEMSLWIAKHQFNWHTTTRDLKTDLRLLIYPKGWNDEAKIQVLQNTYGDLGERINWPDYVRLWVKHTVYSSRRSPIGQPLKFILSRLDKPAELLTSLREGVLRANGVTVHRPQSHQGPTTISEALSSLPPTFHTAEKP
jgi:hypothetical protein